ncbi:MAG TPA: protein kinase [Polyangia bacterium]
MRSRFAPDQVVRPGQHVGKYVLGELIARGGMAEVWGARVEGPQGFVKSLALKFVLESFSGDSELERLFVNEARLAAQLQHANLVSVFDFDKVPDPDGSSVGRYFIAMERVDGHDLRRVLQTAHHRGRRLPAALSLYVAGEVLKGLRYVHERRDPETQRPLGLIHRDVSPHNILVGFAGEVKLSDFGIAKAMTQNLGTQSGTIRGKLAYASPEQLRAEPLDHRTDQFALGVTLWEALAGQRLFDGPDELTIMSKVVNGVIPPLPASAGVDAATEAVVRRMLAPAARNRFPTTADALAAVLGARGYTADSGPLIALLHDLFHPAVIELPRTAPLEPEAVDQVEAARAGGTLRHDAAGETSPLEPSEPARPAALATEKSGSARRKTPPPGLLRPPEVAREPTRSTTGSAYVSGAVPDEAFVAPRGRPAAWVAFGVVAAGLLTGGLVMVGRRMAGPTPASHASAGPEEPRPRVDDDRANADRGNADQGTARPPEMTGVRGTAAELPVDVAVNRGSARLPGVEAAGGGPGISAHDTTLDRPGGDELRRPPRDHEAGEVDRLGARVKRSSRDPSHEGPGQRIERQTGTPEGSEVPPGGDGPRVDRPRRSLARTLAEPSAPPEKAPSAERRGPSGASVRSESETSSSPEGQNESPVLR